MSRSPVVFAAGGKSPIAGLWTALIVAMVLLIIAQTFEDLPKATVAAIIAVAIGSLFEFKELIALWRYDKADLAMSIFTFFCTFGLGIQRGIFIALGVSVLIVLATSSSLRADFLGRVPEATPPEYVSLAVLDRQNDHKKDHSEGGSDADAKEGDGEGGGGKGEGEGGGKGGKGAGGDGKKKDTAALTDAEYDDVDRKVMMIRVLEPVIYFANANCVEDMVRRKVREFKERFVTEQNSKGFGPAGSKSPAGGDDGKDGDGDGDGKSKDRECCGSLLGAWEGQQVVLAGIVIDLQLVTRMDSTAVGMLLTMYKVMNAQGVQLRFVNVGGSGSSPDDVTRREYTRHQMAHHGLGYELCNFEYHSEAVEDIARALLALAAEKSDA